MEALKNRLVIILGITNILFLIFAVGSCSATHSSKIQQQKEMALRFDSEEKKGQILKDKLILEDKIKGLEQALVDEKASQDKINKALTQEQLVNESLKVELDKIIKLKESLEQQLKSAVVSGKVEKPKK